MKARAITEAEANLVAAAIEERRTSRILTRRRMTTGDMPYWEAWREAFQAYKCAVNRVVRERKAI